jgi:ABC-type Na+ efflux pump permease subunit
MMGPAAALFLRKELREVRHNPQIWPGYLLLPLIGIALPLIFLAVMPVNVEAASDPDVAALLRLAGRDPALAAFPVAQRIPRLVVRDMGLFFLLIPVILSAMSAAMSIAVEKQQRTLEPLLATPVSVRELLWAKLMAVLAPATLATWVAAGVSVALSAITTFARHGDVFWPGVPYALTIVVIAPLCGAVAALQAMGVSIRARDVQSAVHLAGLWTIPAGMVFVGLIGRLALRSVWMGLIGATIAAALAAWLFARNVRRFEREEVLTRWL